MRVSRASRMFVHRLLEAEVPEIKAGTVQVRGIAREPGLRTKIAVSSTQAGLDPVGACVGPKGVRHRAILSELASEHVDIVPWSDDAEAFVASSLGPAKAESVSIDRMTRTATVLVPRAQLSLAIGRDGQNARLAAKLTGFRIDIKAGEAMPTAEALPNPPREPVRTCVACREEAGKGALVRVVRRPDGAAAVDRTGHAPGPGRIPPLGRRMHRNCAQAQGPGAVAEGHRRARGLG